MAGRQNPPKGPEGSPQTKAEFEQYLRDVAFWGLKRLGVIAKEARLGAGEKGPDPKLEIMAIKALLDYQEKVMRQGARASSSGGRRDEAERPGVREDLQRRTEEIMARAKGGTP